MLTRAHSPDNPDWRILSVQGTALDQLGRHEEARRYYASALKIVPDEPSVLSNLGLSYVLSKELPKAEETLRRAHASTRADARVRQNLGLRSVCRAGLPRPKVSSRRTLPAEEAAANVAYLKQMLAPERQPARRWWRDAAGGMLNRPDGSLHPDDQGCRPLRGKNRVSALYRRFPDTVLCRVSGGRVSGDATFSMFRLVPTQ